ncbi:MAG: Gfo/Idh/MocA family oxidoreductase [Deltaproteobacteria bacterium]|nr:Gfo/Idh/MocA family oxidoreductase [Deltaproteobacteria bacterium]
MKPLRVGVVGVGYLGKFHAQKYACMKDVTLAGVVDIIDERARKVAAEFETKPFSDYRDLAGKVDAVSVVVPTPLHFPVSRWFLENDVDVLIEKPMAGSVDEADTLVGLADSRERIIQVGHLERFNPAVVALTQAVECPLFIESHRLSLFNERGTEVDVVLDLMIHDLDVILHVVQSEIRDIHAVGVPVVTPRVDIANARLIFENGCVANVTASRISMKTMRKIRIFQKDAYISVDYASRDIMVIRKDNQGSGLPVPGMSMDRSAFKAADPLGEELASFVESVRWRRPPVVTGRDGRNALRVAVDIAEQIKSGAKAMLGSF